MPKMEENWQQSVELPQTMYGFFELTQYLVPAPKTFNLLNSKTDNAEGNVRLRAKIGMVYRRA